MIREDYLHEINNLRMIASILKKEVDLPAKTEEERQQVRINSFADRSLTLLDNMVEEYFKKEK